MSVGSAETGALERAVIDAAIAYREIAATDVIRPTDPRPTLSEMLTKGKAIRDKQDAFFAAVDRLTATTGDET